jgi:hypothetical protein
MSPTPRRQTSSLLTVYVKNPEPTNMKLTPLNHPFLTTIDYHPSPRKYTYQNLYVATSESYQMQQEEEVIF